MHRLTVTLRYKQQKKVAKRAQTTASLYHSSLIDIKNLIIFSSKRIQQVPA